MRSMSWRCPGSAELACVFMIIVARARWRLVPALHPRQKTELRDALRVRANLELEDQLLEKVLRSYDVDNSGTINYQVFPSWICGPC